MNERTVLEDTVLSTQYNTSYLVLDGGHGENEGDGGPHTRHAVFGKPTVLQGSLA
jgi:hypothetical protein